MNYDRLLEKTREYVLSYYKKHENPNLVYHNRQHTEDVVDAATQIAGHYQLSEGNHFVVIAAAWFHDIGYMVDIDNHEDKGIELATTFFEKHKLDDIHIKLVCGCIAATKMPQSPTSLIEEILCDADLFHLGMDDQLKHDNKLLEEYNLLHHTGMDKPEWREKSVKFMEAHSYFTDYCRGLLNAGQQQNINELKKKIKKAHKKLKETAMENDVPFLGPEGEPIIAEKKKKDKDADKPDKGIETMFRISSSNHQRLSDMADQKAHIMITVNSIILSAILSLLLRKLNEYGYLIVPSFILLTISLLAMTFSILSTRPSIPKGTFTRDDVDAKRVNLLFFGNFYKMGLDDFNYGMEKMMLDRQFLYGSLIKDVYSQGIVLGKKYHLLRIAYNIFMYGLIISILAFIIAFVFFSR